MSQQSKTSGAYASVGTTIAVIDPPGLPTITRAEANRMLKQHAQEMFHVARAQRDENIRQFETEFGRTDRIDQNLFKDMQNLQVRFAAIAARQHRYGYGSEPKVSKFTKQLGEIIGELSGHMATNRVMELFAPVEERDYLGMGGTLGRKGFDDSILAGYHILEETRTPKSVAATVVDEEDDQVCLHEKLVPYEDEPRWGVCVECGAEFELRGGESTETESSENGAAA